MLFFIMPKYALIPLTKSPHFKGRIGPMEMQDWYRGLIKTEQLLSRYRDAEIFVISAVRVAGEDSEADSYLRVLKKIGVPSERIRVIRKGYETIEQMGIARG